MVIGARWISKEFWYEFWENGDLYAVGVFLGLFWDVFSSFNRVYFSRVGVRVVFVSNRYVGSHLLCRVVASFFWLLGKVFTRSVLLK